MAPKVYCMEFEIPYNKEGKMVLRRNNKLGRRTKVSDSSDFASRVQQKAYDIYERRGYSHGNDWADWFEAERQIRKELRIK